MDCYIFLYAWEKILYVKQVFFVWVCLVYHIYTLLLFVLNLLKDVHNFSKSDSSQMCFDRVLNMHLVFLSQLAIACSKLTIKAAFTCSNLTKKPTRTRCDICLTIKSPQRRHWPRSDDFIVNFEHISHLVLTFLL